jgi:hypothetical protein
MALTPAEREGLERLETTLTRGLQNLLSSAADTSLQPLAARLRSGGVHITEVRVKIQRDETPMERYEREMRIMDEWHKLFTATRSYKWDDFASACSRKIDITRAWKTAIADAIGVDLSTLRYAEEHGYARWEWLTKLAALPDWTPTPERRSNFSRVAGQLVRRMRHAGMSRHEIAKAFNDFLRDFNGTHVTAADVRYSVDASDDGMP